MQAPPPSSALSRTPAEDEPDFPTVSLHTDDFSAAALAEFNPTLHSEVVKAKTSASGVVLVFLTVLYYPPKLLHAYHSCTEPIRELVCLQIE